jgi:polyhydroxyalkanoate synthesis regulator phasin
VADFDSFARWIAGRSQSIGEGARAEARRVLDVLVERGDLSRAEADSIEAGVANAAESQGRWLDDRVLSPLRNALRGGAGADALEARLAAIEERLARIEAALSSRKRDPDA